MGPASAGRVIAGKYQLLAPLGEGAMGVVWRARQLALGRDVALKLLREDHRDPTHAERLLREARHAASVRDPHVVEVLDLGRSDDGVPYLVFELLEGETLGARLRHGPMPVEDVKRVGVGMLRGLAAVHRAGLLHRDLKPDNVFLAREGGETVVKLLDFGVSRRTVDAHVDVQLTAPGTLLGTPMYMSIEQLRGDVDLDARSDLHSVGAILYEALAGRPPHVESSLAALTVAKVERDPPALGSLNPGLPSALCAVVHRALQRHRSQRFGSAHEMLEAWLAGGGLPVEPRVPTTPLAPTESAPPAPHGNLLQSPNAGVSAAPASMAWPTAVSEQGNATPSPIAPVPAQHVLPATSTGPFPRPAPAPSPGAARVDAAGRSRRLVLLVVGLSALCALGSFCVWLAALGDATGDSQRATPALSEAADGWVVGTPDTLPRLAARWRAIEAPSVRAAVRLQRLDQGGLVRAVVSEDAGVTVANEAAQTLGGPVVPTTLGTAPKWILSLLRGRHNVHVRVGPTADAARVDALQVNTLVTGVEGEIEGLTSPTLGPNPWHFVVAEDSVAGWSTAEELQRYEGCVPSLQPFLPRESPASQREFAGRTVVRRFEALLRQPSPQPGFVMRATSSSGVTSRVGAFLEGRGCVLTPLNLQRVEQPVTRTYIVHGQDSSEPTLLFVRGAVVRMPFERWQAFALGRAESVWNETFTSDERAPLGSRALVSFPKRARIPGRPYLPVRVRPNSRELDEFWRWDGERLVPERAGPAWMDDRSESFGSSYDVEPDE